MTGILLSAFPAGLASLLVFGMPLAYMAKVVLGPKPALAVAIMFGTWAAGFGRAARICVSADADGVVVRNYLRTHWFKWSEVDAITAASMSLVHPAGRGHPCAGLLIKESHRLQPIHATLVYRDWSGRPRKQAIQVTETLRRWGERFGVPVSLTPEDLSRP